MKRKANSEINISKIIKKEKKSENDIKESLDKKKYNKIIELFNKLFNKYKLLNTTRLIGKNLKSIPIKFLIVQNRYFFDIRELYNISKNVNRLYNPYTKQSFSINNKRYIYKTYIKYSNELNEYRRNEIYNIKENSTNIIAKISYIMGKHNLIFNNEKLAKLDVMSLIELFDNISEYNCTEMFLSNYTEDIHKLYILNNEERYMTVLNKIYEIISYKDRNTFCRCLIIEDHIEAI